VSVLVLVDRCYNDNAIATYLLEWEVQSGRESNYLLSAIHRKCACRKIVTDAGWELEERTEQSEKSHEISLSVSSVATDGDTRHRHNINGRAALVKDFIITTRPE